MRNTTATTFFWICQRATRMTLVLAIMNSLIESSKASILTFDITNAAFPISEDFPEGVRINPDYGDRIVDDEPQSASDGSKFEYGDDDGNYTPNITVSYGPFSIFTGGPELWRYHYGNLDRVLYQGSRHTGVGNDYNILEIVLVADPGYDVQLLGFDLGGWQADFTINAVTVYDGVPFPFLTPTNDIFKTSGPVDVAGPGPDNTQFDFSSAPLTAHVIWLQIDANNLGADSEFIGIDNIRFRQIENGNPDQPPVDLSEIDDALQFAAVPEAASAVVWLAGIASVLLVGQRRTVRGERGLVRR